MSTTKDAAKPAQAKPNLAAYYRPVGLKAVAAAALMIKRVPKPTPA